jgi:DnaK suppressor protein
MKQRDLAFFRNLLQARRQEILDETDRAVDSMNGHERINYADPADRAALESDRNFLLRLRDRDRKLLGKIDEALARLEDGSYGRCEECGGQIAIERLKARPVTTFCIECKASQEEREKGR